MSNCMMTNAKKALTAVTATLVVSSMTVVVSPVQAESDLKHNPVVKQAAIGGAVGAAAGGLSKESSIWKGLGIGALVGAGTGLLDSSRALDDKPLVKDAAKGAAIGAGTGAVVDSGVGKGAAVGAGAGAGWHFLKKYLDK